VPCARYPAHADGVRVGDNKWARSPHGLPAAVVHAFTTALALCLLHRLASGRTRVLGMSCRRAGRNPQRSAPLPAGCRLPSRRHAARHPGWHMRRSPARLQAAPPGAERAPTDLPPDPTAQRPPHEMLFSCCRMSCVASAAVPSGMCARWSYLRARSSDRVRAVGLGPPSGMLSRIFLYFAWMCHDLKGVWPDNACSPPLYQPGCTVGIERDPKKPPLVHCHLSLKKAQRIVSWPQ